MVNAHLSKNQQTGNIHVWFVTDEGKIVGENNCTNTAEAERLMYIHNRDLIFLTLQNWLLQRGYALQICNSNKAIICRNLSHEFGFYKLASYNAILKIVSKYYREFIGIAPSNKSNHFKYYTNTIHPILAFCRDQQNNGA